MHLITGLQIEFPSMRGPIIIDVVERQEGWLSFSATCTDVATIGLINLVSGLLPAGIVTLIDPIAPDYRFDRRHDIYTLGPLAILPLVHFGTPYSERLRRQSGCFGSPCIPCVVTAAGIARIVHGFPRKVGRRLADAAFGACGVGLEFIPTQVLAQDCLGLGHTRN
jgi:hypothetical protein